MLTAALTVLFFIAITAVASASIWPMFHYNAQHNGRSPYTGPQDNTILWTYDSIEDKVYSSPAINSDGTIYVGSEDHNLYAINPDGTLKWTYTTDGGIFSSPAIGSDGTIYIGSRDHNLYAIKPDGTLEWLYGTGGEINAPPTIGDDGTIYIGSYDHNLYALNPDGTLKCKYDAGGFIHSSPAIGSDGIIYVGSSNGLLNALYSNCTLKWTSDPIHGIWTHPALSPDGTVVYHGADDGYLYARYTSNGSIKWKSPWTYGGIQSSPAIGSDGTIYVGTQYGNLWAIDPEDGSLKWNYYTTLSAWSSPAIGADDTIYFATNYGRIYAMNPNGEAKWIYNGNAVDDGHFYSSPAIGSNGILYVGSTKGKLYAFGPVYVDINPGTCPNLLNLKSKGVIHIAIIGTSDFDVATVDTKTILLKLNPDGKKRVAPIRWNYENVATPFKGELCDCHDLNGDEYMDLVLTFRTQELVETLQLGEFAGETISLTITGNLKADEGGTSIKGKDCLLVKNKAK